MLVVKQRKPKRVSVMELGAGNQPYGIVGHAKRALKKRFGRTFEASDPLANPNIFRVMGLSKMPHNAKVLKQCSLKHLRETSAASKDVIFGSYFLSAFVMQHPKGHVVGAQECINLFKEIKRVLKKNGRAIFIVDLMGSRDYVTVAKELGLRTTMKKFVPNPEQTYSDWIDERSTRVG
jgi:hypothetical protein